MEARARWLKPKKKKKKKKKREAKGEIYIIYIVTTGAADVQANKQFDNSRSKNRLSTTKEPQTGLVPRWSTIEYPNPVLPRLHSTSGQHYASFVRYL